MEDPVWRFQPRADDNQTVQSLMKYTNSIVGSVWTSPGYLLIDSPWEEQPGDLDFDPNRFQVKITSNAFFLLQLKQQYLIHLGFE